MIIGIGIGFVVILFIIILCCIGGNKEKTEDTTKQPIEMDFQKKDRNRNLRKPKPLQIEIHEGDTGYSLPKLIFPYIIGGTRITIYDPYIRTTWQIENLRYLLEKVLKAKSIKRVTVITVPPEKEYESLWKKQMGILKNSLSSIGVKFEFQFNKFQHDRKITVNNGQTIHLGRGINVYYPTEGLALGGGDPEYRHWRQTGIHSVFNEKYDETGYYDSLEG